VVALTCTAPPHQATRWTGRARAKATGISLGSVQRIWRAYKLQPHRLRTVKRSRDPGCTAKLTDIEREVAADRPIHFVLGSYATHKPPKVLAWLTPIRAGRSTLPRLRPPGSTRSRMSFPR
jgi:hypothetical protein